MYREQEIEPRFNGAKVRTKSIISRSQCQTEKSFARPSVSKLLYPIESVSRSVSGASGGSASDALELFFSVVL